MSETHLDSYFENENVVEHEPFSRNPSGAKNHQPSNVTTNAQVPVQTVKSQ